jgi:hypothetical protein
MSKMITVVVSVMLACMGLVVPASANGALMCKFGSGVVKTFEKGVFKDEKVEALEFTIDDVDLVRQTASLLTKQGRGDLKIVRAIGANHFLEVVTEGFLNMTTVYEAAGPGAPMPAVHSRHFGFFGAPFVSQYHGTCVAK